MIHIYSLDMQGQAANMEKAWGMVADSAQLCPGKGSFENNKSEGE
jgi:hypothetical protein